MKQLIGLLLFSAAAFAQFQNVPGTAYPALESVLNAKPAVQVSVLAASGNCTAGKDWWSNTALGDVYYCTATNTWTKVFSANGTLFSAVVIGPKTIGAGASQLPAAASGNTNWMTTVTDAASASDCTVGSGTAKALCISNGTAWVPLSYDGGVPPTSAAFVGTNSAHQLVASSTLTDDGTNLNVIGRNLSVGNRVLSDSTSTTPQIVFDGDSITTSAGGTFLWPTTVVAPGFNIYNVAVGGQTMATIRANGAAHVDSLYRAGAASNILYIDAGTNDGQADSTALQTYDNLRAYCLARRAAGWTVVVGTMISRQALDTFKNAYNALIRNGWPEFADGLVDYAANTALGADGAYANTLVFNVDQVHPLDAGNYLMVSTAQRAFNTLIASASSNPQSAEMVVNGNFSSGTGWTFGSGCSLSGGAVTSVANSAWCAYRVDVGTTNNVYYEVTFDLTSTAGVARALLGGASGSLATSPNYSAPGTYTVVIMATSGANGSAGFIGGSFTGTIDNASIKTISTSPSVRSLPNLLVAPSGSCGANGAWAFSQDGHATVCLSGTWTSKI